jgi:hypothetical protein
MAFFYVFSPPKCKTLVEREQGKRKTITQMPELLIRTILIKKITKK